MDSLARKLERASLVKENISFYSHKTSSSQYCESRLEADAALLREFDPTIQKYVTQPTSIFYMKNGRKIRYTPDALVQTTDGKFYFEEVKPISLINTAEFKDKFSFLIRYFNEVIGYPLVINAVEKDCATIANYQNLYFYQQQEMHEKDARKLLRNSPIQTCINELCAIAAAIKVDIALVWQLIARGCYHFNNKILMNKDTKLERKQNDE